jgi:hypothetical protein
MKNLRQIRKFIRRSLREKERGNLHYDRSAQALIAARNLGLVPGVEIEMTFRGPDGEKLKEPFELVNNFRDDAEAIYRPARVPHYELKRVPKTKRVNNQGAAVSKPPSDGHA